ncbi:MAG: F0F1 ATP synthase subunit delta [Armatimonadetes bacterium]|nr:F0F1 ATP synthase subunit delta [Armatimonadota bacterium]
MVERRIVRRYAKALFEAARKADAVDRVESDLGFVAYTFEIAPSLMKAVRSPLIPRDRKKAVVRELFADKVHELALSFLDLLIDKRREEIALDVQAEYIALADEARGIVKAEVTSAIPLTRSEESLLAEKLSRLTGKRVELSTVVDLGVIGGVTVRIGDTVIDGSIRGQLRVLKEKLME